MKKLPPGDKELENKIKELEDKTIKIIQTLHPLEQIVIGLTTGFEMKDNDIHEHKIYSSKEIAKVLGLKPQEIDFVNDNAFRQFRGAGRPFGDIEKELSKPTNELLTRIQIFRSPPTKLVDVVEAAETLTPDLIAHLKSHSDDLDKLQWDVFEHLVGEFLTSRGFQDVRLVGRDPKTSADIYAAATYGSLGVKLRFFIEVKRNRSAVGIQVINEVLGAMITERDQFGWHAGLIVSTGGFRRTRKYTPLELSLRGIEMKDKRDLLMWLEDYQPDKNGLWLPNPQRSMPQE